MAKISAEIKICWILNINILVCSKIDKSHYNLCNSITIEIIYLLAVINGGTGFIGTWDWDLPIFWDSDFGV